MREWALTGRVLVHHTPRTMAARDRVTSLTSTTRISLCTGRWRHRLVASAEFVELTPELGDFGLQLQDPLRAGHGHALADTAQ